MFTAPYYPIVLIRGFAALDSNIEEAANQTFLGYEAGSTKTRQDASGQIRPFFFESVIVRLMKDHGYDISHRSNLLGYDSDERVPAKSIWTHRYYDLASRTYGGQRLPMEEYAKDLRKVIVRIRDKICGADKAARDAFKVHLVAHSQGGLVARSYLQNICRGRTPLSEDEQRELDMPANGGAPSLVAGLFTYGTPHNGIEFLDRNVPDLGPFSWLQARNFNRDAIREYLGIKGENRLAHDLDGAIEPDKVFCLVGTNWSDYDQVSKSLTKEMSDGLVMCRNAYTVDTSQGQPRYSPRAYVSRAHGGPIGMVNSEEGYQNLRRFLFGDWRVDVDVKLDAIRLPEELLRKLKKGQKADGNYVLNVIASVRGQQVKLHERRSETASGVRFPVTYTRTPGADSLFDLQADGRVDPQRTVATLFLMSQLSSETAADKSGPMEFALQLKLEKPAFEIDRLFWLDEHIEGLATLRETIRFRVDPKAGQVLYDKVQQAGIARPTTPLTQITGALKDDAGLFGEVPFGPASDAVLAPGEARGRVLINVRRREALT